MASVTDLGFAQSAANATQYIFNSGYTLTAGKIAVGIGTRAAGAACAITGVTIGGVAASVRVTAANTDASVAGTTRSAIYVADQLAANNDIVVDVSPSAARCGIQVWRLDNTDISAAFDTASSVVDGNAADQTGTIDTPANGVLLAYSHGTGGGAWRHGAGSALTTAQSNLTVTADETAGAYTWTGVAEDLDAVMEAAVAAGDGCMVAVAFSPAAAASGVTGTLAATESGPDTAALGGTVRVSGTLAATESGADAAVLSGAVKISGTLAATEVGSDAVAGAGTVRVSAAMGPTETGSDTALINLGVPIISGTLAATETGPDTAALNGRVRVTSALAVAEVGADTALISGSLGLLAIGATLAAQEVGLDAAAVSGRVIVSAALVGVEVGADTAQAAGASSISGTLAAFEVGPDAAAVEIETAIAGTLAATETGSDSAAIALRIRPIEPNVELVGSLAAATLHGRLATPRRLQARQSAIHRLRGRS